MARQERALTHPGPGRPCFRKAGSTKVREGGKKTSEQRQQEGRKAKVILICTRKTFFFFCFSSSFQMILIKKKKKKKSQPKNEGLFSKPGFRDLSNDIADKQPLADSEGAKVIF